MTLHQFITRVLDCAGPLLPARWRLPVRYYGWVNSSDTEPELVHLFALCRQFRCAVDVGANHGYYSFKMARRFQRVCAFEANPQIDYDIRHYKKSNLHFYAYGLSDQTRRTNLYVPVHRGIPYIGWANLANRELPFADAYETVQVDLQRLDDQVFVWETAVDLIKIDVEGHELEVLRGGLETIRRDRPVLIIENNPDQSAAIQALLEETGYRKTTLAAWMGVPASSPNLIYLPD